MAAQARIVIKGENQLKGPLKQSQKELDVFAQDINKIGKRIESAFTLTAIIAAVGKLTNALKDCAKEYAEVEQVTKRLEAVWKNVGSVTGKTTKQIDDYAESIEKTTYFTKEAVQESAILLAATEKLTDKGFERALSVSVDLAAALGEDVTSAASTLAKTLEDPVAALNRLKTIGVTFTQAEKDQIKALSDANQMYEAQTIILDKIEAKYKDVAKAINDTPAGKLQNIKDLLSDIRKNIGQSLLNSISPALDSLYEDLKKLFDLVNPYIDKGTFSISKDLERMISTYGSYWARAMYNGADYLKPGTTQYNVAQSLLKEIYAQVEKEGLTVDNLNSLLKEYKTTLDGKTGSWNRSDYLFGSKDSYSSAYAQYLGMFALLEDSKYSGKSSSFAVESIETSTNAIEETTSVLADTLSEFEKFMTSYVDSTVFKSYQYQKIIDTATGFLNTINNYREDIITGDGAQAVAALLGLPIDTLPGDILLMAQELEEVIETYKTKLEDLNTTIESEATNLGLNFSVKSIDPFGLNNPFNKKPLNGINAILGTGLNLGFGDFWNNLESALGKYGSKSESYQQYLLEQEINKVKNVLTSAFIDESSPVFTYMSEILETLEIQLAQMKKSEKGSSGSGGVKGQGALGRMSGEIQNFINAADAVWEDFKGQIGEAGDLINRLGTNMAQFGPLLGAIVTALHYVIEGLVQELGDIIGEFVQWGLEPLREFGRMIGQILLPILKEIMPSVVATGRVLMNLFQSLARLLAPIVQILMRVIGPVLTALADVLVVIVGTISWAIDWIAYCITWVLNKISFGWIAQTARPADYQSYIDGMLQIPGEGYDSLSSSGSVGTTNASYSGGTVIHLNVYQQGVVCGDNGILEFATMIKNELADAQYLGR